MPKSRRLLLGLCLATLVAGTASGQHVLTTITAGREPCAVVYDSIDNKVFVANRGSATVSVIDPVTNTVTATIPVGQGPNALCWTSGSNKLFVACAPVEGNGWVYVINAATDQIVASISVGRNPCALAWASARNKVYCVNSYPGGPISVLGGADDDSIDVPIIPISQTPNAIAYNPTSNRIYVSSAAMMQAGIVWVINPQTDSVVAQVTCGNSAWELGVNPTANRVYCSNRSSGTVSVINCANNQRLANTQVETEPHSSCWIPTNKVFVGEYWNNTVAFMHGDSQTVRGRFPVPGNPGTMAYLAATQKLYVANYLSSKVSVCDARDGYEGVIVDLDVGSGPLGFAIIPSLKRVYVTNCWDTTVTVIADEFPAPVAETVEPRLLPVMSASPNPAPAGSQVRFQAVGFEPSRLEVHDASGRLVLARPLLHSSLALYASDLPPGVYFCTAGDGLHSATAKLAVR
jgi:YVTN family beta-propeller protein